MEVVWGCFGLVVLWVIVMIPGMLVTYALQKKGKWLKATKVVNGLCVAVAGLAAAYILMVGAARLWDENPLAFLVAGGALAFAIYFYIATVNSRERDRRENELTPKTAEKIVQQYGAALARGCPDGGIARYESSLPCSKLRIKQAAKLFLSVQIEYKSLLEEPTETLLGAISALDQFVPDEKADRINQSSRSVGDVEHWDYMKSMFGVDIRQEMDDFIAQVKRWDAEDPLFHQRVYTLIGLEYSPAIEKKLGLFSDD